MKWEADWETYCKLGEQKADETAGISCITVQRILKEGESNIIQDKPFSKPQKRRLGRKTKLVADKFYKCVNHGEINFMSLNINIQY
jgi:hypothetical protein